MSKKGMTTKSRTTKKCQCSICGQIANAQENTAHHYCKGISLAIIARMPDKFKDITNPTRQGTWLLYQEPQKENAA